jgi:hypothetical protein
MFSVNQTRHPAHARQHTPEIELPPDAATADDHRNPRRRRRDAEEAAPELGLIVSRSLATASTSSSCIPR